jgi:hypothetical protein
MRMKRMEYVVCRWKKRNIYRALVGKPEGKNNLIYLGVDGRIILKWNRMAAHRLDLSRSGEDECWGLLNIVMNPQSPQMWRNYLTN